MLEKAVTLAKTHREIERLAAVVEKIAMIMGDEEIIVVMKANQGRWNSNLIFSEEMEKQPMDLWEYYYVVECLTKYKEGEIADNVVETIIAKLADFVAL